MVVDPCLLPSSQVQKQCCLIFQWQRLNNSIIANILSETFSLSSLNLVSHQWFNGRVVLHLNTKSPVGVLIHFSLRHKSVKKSFLCCATCHWNEKKNQQQDPTSRDSENQLTAFLLLLVVVVVFLHFRLFLF